MKPTKEQLLKQLNELTELAKSKGLIKVDPVTKLPGTFVDKSQEVKKDGSSIQSGISQAAAAGGIPHTTPAGSTMGAINAMGSAFGKSGNLDKHASKEVADQLRAIYGVKSNDEKSISANNNPEPTEKSGSSPDQGPGNGELGMSKSSTQPINENISSHESPMLRSEAEFGELLEKAKKRHEHIGWNKLHSKLEREGYSKEQSDRIAGSIKAKVGKTEGLGKPVPKGVNPDKYDNCVEDVKHKGGAKNAYAVCAASLKKDDEVDKALCASAKGERPEFNKCDKIKGIVGSLKKGFFLP